MIKGHGPPTALDLPLAIPPRRRLAPNVQVHGALTP
jgi:hypothetical protein